MPLLVAVSLWFLAAFAVAQGRADHVPGVVRDEDGTPVKGATVVAVNPKATPHLFATTTDSEGNFYLSGLTAGPWTFTAVAQGYVATEQAVLLEKGGTVPAIEMTIRKRDWQPPPPLRDGRLAGVDLFRLMTELQNADALLRARQYDQAIAIYERVLVQAPALTHANLAIGDACRQKKDLARAAAAYRHVLAAEPGNEMAALGLAGVEADRGALDEADRILSEAAARPRPHREILCALGDVKAAREQPNAAEEWYRKAAAADPSWARPHLKLGLLAVSRNDGNAIGYLEKAIALEPGSPEAAEAGRALAALRK
jgi:tetratricopeptide (TPR) repeat protein